MDGWVIAEAGAPVHPVGLAPGIDDGRARKVRVVPGDLALPSVGEEGPQPTGPGPEVEQVVGQRLAAHSDGGPQVAIGIEEEGIGVAVGDQAGGLGRALGADTDDSGSESLDLSSGRRQLRQLLEARRSTEVSDQDDDGRSVDVGSESGRGAIRGVELDVGEVHVGRLSRALVAVCPPTPRLRRAA